MEIELKKYAQSLGFSSCGIAKAEPMPQEGKYLQDYLSENRHASMSFLAEHTNKRSDIHLIMPEAKSVIVVLSNYYAKNSHQNNDSYKIARYAWGKDYHKVMKQPLQALSHFIQQKYPQAICRCCIDTSPIFEKRWAEKCGLGWIGKHSLLIHPNYGSYCFIGIIITNIPLEYDKEIANQCGTCMQCIRACPNHALQAPYQLDATRCIACQTIENKSDNPLTIKTNQYIYGCDICQDVCPWNQSPKEAFFFPDFNPKQEIITYTKKEWKELSEEQFNNIFKDSPIKRITYNGWVRNIKTVVKE